MLIREILGKNRPRSSSDSGCDDHGIPERVFVPDVNFDSL